MFSFKLPKKTTSMIQVWGSVLLVLVALFFSFTPIFSLETGKNADKIEDFVSDVFDEKIDVPEKVEVSAVDLISGVGAFVGKDLDSKEAQKTVSMIAAIATTFMDTFEEFDLEGREKISFFEILPMILKFMAIMVGLVYILIFTLVLPIMFIVKALKVLIAALTNIKTPEKATLKASKALPGTIGTPLTIMLFSCVVPGMTFASGVTGIFVVAAISILLNVVISRCQAYSKPAMKYLTVLQGAALVGGIGFLVYFFNIIKTGIFDAFITGGWANYAEKVTTLQAAGGKVASFGYLVDLVLLIVYVVIVLGSVSYFKKCAQRISCAKKKGDSSIVKAIFLLLAYIAPKYIMGAKSLLNNPETGKGGGVSSIILSDKAAGALDTALVGLILIVVAEIAFLVLKNTLCKDATEEEQDAVLSGTYVMPAIAAPVEDVAEAAPAEEATVMVTVEENAAPAEETPAEEAPAEEAVEETVEEAPAEEAPAEETPVEEEAVETEGVVSETPVEEIVEEAPAEEAPAEDEAAE